MATSAKPCRQGVADARKAKFIEINEHFRVRRNAVYGVFRGSLELLGEERKRWSNGGSLTHGSCPAPTWFLEVAAKNPAYGAAPPDIRQGYLNNIHAPQPNTAISAKTWLM